ncbi:hypothetical protein BN6_43550 [Saccharothrix espanaensis DSM 44229]|uniref:HTH araC/xylS-type domain-containing protein n=1 Tax=Saccharothrix espanaensis (strain ATCC 51144 / DSM 44229 / JCM 9112 / NBRC 15066 / NRRL 15764) TaxID=1179773 RepID=K0K252_SACES|nr:hypothetical protein BN6_43550 [Saccharothrix espanaensis DSM 44229]
MRAVRRGGARLPRRARHHRAPGGRRRRRGLLAARLTVRAFGGGPRRGGGDGPRPGERPRLPDDPVVEQVVRALPAAGGGQCAHDLCAESAAAFLVTWGVHERPPGPEHAAVRAGIAVMRERLDQPLTLADVAAEAHLSPYHFIRVFRAATGLTPRRYLTRLRIEQARRLLSDNTLTVGQVAETDRRSPKLTEVADPRAGQLDSRTTRSGVNRTWRCSCSRGAIVSARTRLAAVRPISSRGWCTDVSGTAAAAANSMSS